MKFQNLFVVAVLVAVGAMASAQATQRSFSYTSKDAVDQDYSSAGTVTLHAKTKVTVNPYLYIKGNLGAEWTVDGWGSGVDARSEDIKFYHNEGLTLSFSDFANPAKVSGGASGDQAIALKGQLAFSNDASGASLFDSGLVDIANLNSMMTPAGPNFDVASSGGVLKLSFTRRIAITPAVGPGVYENTGTITVIRN
jgi:hypothetical protein